MGLKALIASAVAKGFLALDDIPRPLTYVATGESVYNPSTGTYTPNETEYAIVGVLGSYETREIDGQQVKAFDRKLLIQQAALPITPTLNDRVEVEDGSQWQVLGVNEDPAEVTWELQLRGTSG